MKIRISADMIITFFIIILFSPLNIMAENNDTALAIDLLQQYHFTGLKIDISVINEVKSDFIENLDPDGLIFLETDAAELLSIPLSEEDFSSFDNNEFYKRSVQRYRTRLTETMEIISNICRREQDYYTNETLTGFRDDKAESPKDMTRKESLWNKIVKLKIFSRIYNSYTESAAAETMKSFLAKNEAKTRAEVEKIELRKLKNILNYKDGFDSLTQQIYSNSIVMRFDPHSMMLSSENMNRLISELSPQSSSFGIILNTDFYGRIIVEQVIPGGPAWKSGSISKGDVILSVKIPGDPEIDLSDYDLYEVSQYFDGESDIITLKIRKKNGLVVSNRLRRGKISGSNNVMAGYVLKGSKNFGYIQLPAFYTDWNTPGQLGCSNDVAKEIFKLQQDNIDGLILDLRDNSGGSVDEAISLAGLFIDEGPMAVSLSKGGEYYIYKDPGRGTIYDGPLIVMVNGQSASASEMVASILKDYNRAIIVGNRTFGKGSSQEIIPLKKNLKINSMSDFRDTKSNYYLSYTTSIIYNSKGESYQKNGVIPHILIPEVTGNDSAKEENEKYFIAPAKSLKTVKIERYPDIKYSSLAAKSRGRISGSSRFKAVHSVNSEIRRLSLSNPIPLNADKFLKETNSRFTSGEKFKKSISVKSGIFSAELNSQDKDTLLLNSFIREISREKIQRIDEDVFIDEVYKIAVDYIKNR